MAAFNDKSSLLGDPQRLAKRQNYQFRKPRKARSKNKGPEPTQFHFLDLNPETEATISAARRQRARKGAFIAVTLIVLMGVFSLFKLVWKEAFVNGSTFQLRNIAVITEGALTAEDIVNHSGLHDGMNMLMISLANVRHQIEELPQVKKVEVERSYPGMITIKVRQREPVAWLECPQQSVPAKSRGVHCMLDEKGCVMPQYDGERTDRKLPIIRVEKLKKIVPGEAVQSEVVAAAIKLLNAHENSPMSKYASITKVDGSKGYSLQVDYDSDLKVTFSRYDIDRQMNRLEEVMNHAASTGREPLTVNLLVEKYVPVTFRDASSAPVASSQSGRQPLSPGRILANAN
jgi:cell division septal protein FtsQ